MVSWSNYPEPIEALGKAMYWGQKLRVISRIAGDLKCWRRQVLERPYKWYYYIGGVSPKTPPTLPELLRTSKSPPFLHYVPLCVTNTGICWLYEADTRAGTVPPNLSASFSLQCIQEDA